MAEVTRTASLAIASVQPVSVHTGVTLTGSIDGAGASSTNSGVWLLAKVPTGAKAIQVTAQNVSNNTTTLGMINPDGTSATQSALGITVSQGAYTGPAYSPSWDITANPSYKWVTARIESSGTASLQINYSISYRF